MQTLSAALGRFVKTSAGGDPVQGLPDLLGDERHDRMQQPAEPIEDVDHDPLGEPARAVASAEPRL